MAENKQYRYDLHVHSANSDGRLTLPKTALLAARRGLSGFAVTDHTYSPSPRMMDGVRKALQGTPYEDQVDIFPGGELDFWHNGVHGHASLIASPIANLTILEKKLIYLRHKDPNIDYLIHWARDNMLALVFNHPAQPGLSGFSLDAINDGCEQTKYKGAVGVEVLSGTSHVAFPAAFRVSESKIRQSAKDNGLAPIAGSDTHLPVTLGRVYTVVSAHGPMHTPQDRFENLLLCMAARETYPKSDLGDLSTMELGFNRVMIAINEAAKVLGRKLIPDVDTKKYDPFQPGRLFMVLTRQMSLSDYQETLSLKAEQRKCLKALVCEIRARQAQTVFVK